MRIKRLLLGFILCLVAELCLAQPVLRFGQTAALTGPLQALGEDMREGLLLAFEEANANGGVKGYQLELISLNDNYEPIQAIDNVHQLLNKYQVFGLIGTVGTPTANAILPIVSRLKVPLIGPFTGAEILRYPYQPYVINVRASYWQETEALINYVVDTLGLKKIAVLFQDDSFGQAGLSGVERALEKRQLKPVARATYRRNTTAIKKAALQLRQVEPEAIVMIGAYLPCSEFVKLSKKLRVGSKFLTISFVGSEAFIDAVGVDGQGVIISQVLPSPKDPSHPIVAHYLKVKKKYQPSQNASFVSLEAYLVGRLNIEIIKSISGELTRENYLKALKAQHSFEIEGVQLNFDATNNQGLNDIFLTEIDDKSQLKLIQKVVVEQ